LYVIYCCVALCGQHCVSALASARPLFSAKSFDITEILLK